ncbi:MAG: hypothetical protein RL095_1572 [Verrucomicrobiota bacterium]|jgi:hypothetical protein
MRHYLICLLLSLGGIATAAEKPMILLPAEGEKPPLPDIAIEAMAKRIDALLGAAWQAKGLAAPADVDDASFLRRAYLEIAGRIPTLKEIEAFEEDRRSHRRGELVRQLIRSPAAASHDFNLWADTLRVKSRLQGNVPSGNWQEWLKGALSRDMPWNEMTLAMLASEGHALAPGNGATGYLLRDRGMPLDNMANSMRVFLGTSMVCAQCHDHPFNDWTQQEFYKLAAFTGGLQYQEKLRQTGNNKEVRAAIEAEFKENKKLQGIYRRLQDISTHGIAGSGTGTIRLPKDYKYDDAKPGDLVLAETPFGAKIPLPFSEADIAKAMKREDAKIAQKNKKKASPLAPGRQLESRPAFASWVASPDNPMFTRNIVNRIWARVMGRGLIEPLDNMELNDLGSVPGLMEELERDMKVLGYRMAEFRRVLYATRAWQAQAYTGKSDEHYLFQGPLFRRLSPEQTWDSIVALAQPDPEAGSSQIDKETGEQLRIFPLVKNKSPMELLALAKEIDSAGLKAWLDKNAPPTQNPDAKLAMLASKEEGGLTAKAEKKAGKNKKRNGKADLQLRASELPQPAPANHFLARFGQSEREDVDAASLEVSVPQALSLMNGEIERLITRNRNSHLMDDLEALSTPEEIIKTAYKAILCRAPSSKESAVFLPRVKEDSIKGTEDLIWILINSNEFLFRR